LRLGGVSVIAGEATLCMVMAIAPWVAVCAVECVLICN
jgi:hypothetical protein